MAVSSRAEFEEYILRKLGKPVINVNVASEQISDRIDEALEMFFEEHDEGSYRAYITHELTQADIDDQAIEVPDDVYSIHKIHSGGVFNNQGLFSAEYMITSDTILRSGFQMYDYYMMRQQLAEIDHQLNSTQYRFNRSMNKVWIDGLQDKLPGDYVVLEGYKIVGESFERVFNNMWLKKYATALTKEQWGTNTKKFTGVQLPGGVELDGQKIYDEAREEIKELEEELRQKWSSPAPFLIG